MKQFFPKTQTINKDRLYYINDNIFIKKDSIISRGKNEWATLNILNGNKFFPTPLKNYINDGYNVIEMSFIGGETLENCINSLTKEDKVKIVKDLIKIIAIMMDLNLTHGDINESNILYNLETKSTYLIDFETSKTDFSLLDLSSYRGLQYIINFLKI